MSAWSFSRGLKLTRVESAQTLFSSPFQHAIEANISLSLTNKQSSHVMPLGKHDLQSVYIVNNNHLYKTAPTMALHYSSTAKSNTLVQAQDSKHAV